MAGRWRDGRWRGAIARVARRLRAVRYISAIDPVTIELQRARLWPGSARGEEGRGEGRREGWTTYLFAFVSDQLRVSVSERCPITADGLVGFIRVFPTDTLFILSDTKRSV